MHDLILTVPIKPLYGLMGTVNGYKPFLCRVK